MDKKFVLESNMVMMQALSDMPDIELTEKEYAVDYVLKNPPKYASKNKAVWGEAFREYLSRQGLDMDKIKKVDNVEWNEVIRIYNTLIGKKNRKRPEGFKRGQKNKDLIASDTQMEGFIMDKNYLKETNEMFAESEMEGFKQSEVLHLKCTDIYKISEQFLGDDHVNFLATHSKGEAQDNLNKVEFADALCNYDVEQCFAVKERLLKVNALRRRHMEIEEEEDRLDKILEALDAEEDQIKSELSGMGLVPEEEDEEEPEIYNESVDRGWRDGQISWLSAEFEEGSLVDTKNN